MDLTIEDVRQLTFELWLERRENAILRATNDELKNLLNQATAKPDGGDHGDSRG